MVRLFSSTCDQILLQGIKSTCSLMQQGLIFHSTGQWNNRSIGALTFFWEVVGHKTNNGGSHKTTNGEAINDKQLCEAASLAVLFYCLWQWLLKAT